VHDVLEEVGVEDSKKLLVLNKSDQLSLEQQQALMEEFPDAMMTSTRNSADISKLHKYIVGVAQDEMIEDEVIIPYTAKGIIGEIRANMSVIKEEYEYSHIKLTVRSNAIDLERLKKSMLGLSTDDS
jgi:GTP-binding protein HflX